MADWFDDNGKLVAWLAGISLVMFLATPAIVPVVIVRMPADYFLHKKPPAESWRSHHPAVRWSAIIGKNVLGAVFLAAGVAMLVTPGQGWLTILIGLGLLDFPGKRKLELWLIRRRPILRSVNWIRRRAHRQPLQLPDGMTLVDSQA
jgi:hypothetical protein